MSAERIFLIVSIVAVVISLIGGFIIMGSPGTARRMRFDQLRVNDLSNMQSRIINFWQTKGVLPASPEQFEDSVSGYKLPTDPKTGKAYEYKATGQQFTLCADFDLESKDQSQTRYYYEYGEGNWQHGAGKQCFDRTIDRELYPVRPKPY